MKKYFTSESVTEGHPDKLCDTISDNILDAFLEEDETSRVAVETVAGKETIFVTGEITSKGTVDIEKIVREVIKNTGYFGEQDIDYKTCNVIINISKQSPDIAMGVLKDGAGDQGMMFGFACNETKEYLPLGVVLSHKLTKRLTEVRKKGIIKDIGPDGKSEVTIEYENGKPKRVENVVISVEHRESKDIAKLRKEVENLVIKEVIDNKYLDNNTKIYINETGKFVIGGPRGDSGLTGRKIIVDTYGGYAHHGGGAFSGKDATKVDRSAAYMARMIAKNVVANNYAEKCEVSLAYVIGKKDPVAVDLETFNTEKIPVDEIINKIKKAFPLTPKGIIEYLDLRKPFYKKTTNYGHFGKLDMPYEKIIKM